MFDWSLVGQNTPLGLLVPRVPQITLLTLVSPRGYGGSVWLELGWPKLASQIACDSSPAHKFAHLGVSDGVRRKCLTGAWLARTDCGRFVHNLALHPIGACRECISLDAVGTYRWAPSQAPSIATHRGALCWPHPRWSSQPVDTFRWRRSLEPFTAPLHRLVDGVVPNLY